MTKKIDKSPARMIQKRRVIQGAKHKLPITETKESVSL